MAKAKKNVVEKTAKKQKIDMKVLGTRIIVGILALLMVGGTIFSVIAYI